MGAELAEFLGMFLDDLDRLQVSSSCVVGTEQYLAAGYLHRIKMLTRVFGNIRVLESYAVKNAKT
jgi:hypothetical protein